MGLGRRLLMVPAVIGVPVHELSHYFAVKLFALCGAKYKVASMKLFQPMKDGTLGYVEYAYAKAWYTPFANLIIGMAPLAGGFTAFYLLSSTLIPGFSQLLVAELKQVSSAAEAIELSGHLAMLLWYSDWSIKTVSWAFLSASVLAFMLPSKADFQGAQAGIVVCFGLAVAAVMFFPELNESLSVAFSFTLILLPVIILTNALLFLVSMVVRVFRLTGRRRKSGAAK